MSQQLFAAEAADPCCLRDGEADRILAGHPWAAFAVIGDSIAEGLGDPVPGYRDQPWCDRIADALRRQRPGLRYLNLGRRNTPAVAVRATQLEPALSFGPDLALISCGGYDLLRFSYDADAVEAEIRASAAALIGGGCDVITVGPFDGSRAPSVPPALGQRLGVRLHDLARRIAAISAELGTVHVELTHHPASGDPDIYSSDPRHGTMRGHAIAAAETIRRLGAWLDAPGRRST
ncbi:MAG TPA: SGNH/GDSL hydrolase family protein [Streptosporangiaceae bacterium]|nr:SGNH/GDSL hydrolase family protein [Streptosporangiaceae bacterium]